MNRLLSKFKRIVSLLCGKRSHRIIAAVLSVVVVLSVCASLIMPAMSATEDYVSDNGIMLMSNDESVEEFLDAYKAFVKSGGEAYDFGSSITDVDWNSTSEGNVVEGTFTVDYEIIQTNGLLVNANQPYIVLQLDEHIAVPDGGLPTDGLGNVSDSNGNIVGNYHITNDGLIIIRFNENKFDESDGNNFLNTIKGSVSFKTEIVRTEEEWQTQVEFKLGDQIVKIEGFTEKTFSFKKTASSIKSDGSIDYTITIENPQGDNYSGYAIYDEMFKREGVTVTSDPENIGTFDAASGTYTLGDTTNQRTITLTYNVKLTEAELIPSDENGSFVSGSTITNSAKFLDTDNAEKDSDTTWTEIKTPFWIYKSSSEDKANGRIQWKINIGQNSPNAVPLDGSKIYDDYFKGLKASDITVNTSGVNVELNTEDGYIKINDPEKHNSIEIVYYTDAEVGKTYSNTATIKTDNDIEIADSTSSITCNDVRIDKSGNAASDKQSFNWSIVINNFGKPSDINGYWIKDDMIKNYSDDVKVTYGWNGDVLDSEYYEISEEGQITFKNLPDNGSLSFDRVVISYSTPLESASPTEDGGYTITNNATVGKGDDTEVGSDSATVTVTPTNTISKIHGNAQYDEESGTLTIPWTITIEQEKGVFKGRTLNDIMVSSDNENAPHYITPEQLGAISVSDGNNNDLSSYVTTNPIASEATENQANFDITFKDDSALDDVEKVIITYYTTAYVGDVGVGESVSFNNKVTFNGNTSEDPLPYENVDTSKAPYEKGISDEKTGIVENGSVNKTVDDLKVIKIDGVDYYKIKYVITVNDTTKYPVGTAFKITDTFPSGFSYYHDDGVIWNCSNGYTQDISTWINTGQSTYVRFNEDNGHLEFALDPNYNNYKSTVSFSLVIPKAELDKKIADDPNYTIKNTISDGTYTDVTSEIGFKEETSVLTKEKLSGYGNNEDGAGYITYSVGVNPERNNLASGDTITLTDIMSAESAIVNGVTYPCNDPGAIGLSLVAIKVEAIGEDGTVTELDTSRYQYVLDNNPEIKTVNGMGTITSGVTVGSGCVDKGFKISGVVPGADTTVKLYSDNYQGNVPYVWCGNGQSDGSNGDVFNGNASSDVENECYYINIDGSKIKGDTIYLGWNSSIMNITNVEASYTKTGHEYAAKLDITVPDETYIRISYRYMASRKETADNNDDYVTAVNTVKIQSSYVGDVIEESKEQFQISSTSEAIADAASRPITLRKVDVGDNSTLLSAKFNLYRWNNADSKWEAASGLEDSNDGTYKTVSAWSDESSGTKADIDISNNANYSIRLDASADDYLYKLVETEGPEGYVFDADAPTVKYFSVGAYTGVKPADCTNYEVVIFGGTLNIQNYKKISVDVLKSWADGKDDHGDITVTLYKSSTPMTDGFPTDLTEVETVTFGQNENWYYKWEDLPSGTTDGKPIYYYVKEQAYEENGETYLAFYVGNGLNTDGRINITNTSGLTVKKIWLNYDGETCDPFVSEIRFKIYRSTTHSYDDSLPSDAEQWIGEGCDADGWYTLNADNNWIITLKDVQPHVKGDNTTPYYYYVVEDTSSLTDNKVSYLGNGGGSTELVTIINRSTKIIIGEMPETGGPGTFAYTLTGGLIIVCAAAAYVLRKRLQRNSR